MIREEVTTVEINGKSVEYITLQELKAIASSSDPNPWNFEYRGVVFTHENDLHYIFTNSEKRQGQNYITSSHTLLILADGVAVKITTSAFNEIFINN